MSTPTRLIAIQQFPFFSLPKEVRQIVYYFVFESLDFFPRTAELLSPLLVCRQMNAECAEIARSQTVWHVARYDAPTFRGKSAYHHSVAMWQVQKHFSHGSKSLVPNYILDNVTSLSISVRGFDEILAANHPVTGTYMFPNVRRLGVQLHGDCIYRVMLAAFFGLPRLQVVVAAGTKHDGMFQLEVPADFSNDDIHYEKKERRQFESFLDASCHYRNGHFEIEEKPYKGTNWLCVGTPDEFGVGGVASGVKHVHLYNCDLESAAELAMKPWRNECLSKKRGYVDCTSYSVLVF